MDPTKKELYTTTRSAGLDTKDPTLNSQIEEFKTKNDHYDWLLSRLEGTSLKYCGSGNGVDSLLSLIENNEVYCGFVKVVNNGRVKCYSFYFVGEFTPAMRKGKAFMFKNAATGVVECHGEIKCPSSKDEFTVEYFQGEVRKCQ